MVYKIYVTVYKIYVMLFRKYIEKYKADLEINISYPIQMSLAKKYNDINGKLADGDNKDMELNKLWYDLVMAAREVTSILHHSAQRCEYKLV